MPATKTIRQKFKSSIRRGTGEAILLMQKYPALDFSKAIIKACLVNYAYDGQSEGSRTDYLLEMITCSKRKNKIRTAILKGLRKEKTNTWALEQLFELATYFAKKGDNEARGAIYKRFYHKIIPGSDWCGQQAIINLDGFEGLKYIAATFGKALAKDPDDLQDDLLISQFQDDNPLIKVRRDLEEAGRQNHYIKIYLDVIDQVETSRKEYVRPVINYALVTERINKKALMPINTLSARELSLEDIKRLADDFLIETDPIKIERYMRVFDKVTYPYDYKPILEIAAGNNKENERLVEFASSVLKNFSGIDIRRLAVKRLTTSKEPQDYLDLLVSNYKKGDHKLLTEVVKNCKTEDSVHFIVYSLISIYTANKTPKCREPLEAIYQRLTCGIHREDIVKILIENNVLSKRISKEIRYDSVPEIRQLAAT